MRVPLVEVLLNAILDACSAKYSVTAAKFLDPPSYSVSAVAGELQMDFHRFLWIENFAAITEYFADRNEKLYPTRDRGITNNDGPSAEI